MQICKIYLAGAMSGLSFDQQIKWRIRFTEALKYGDFNLDKKPIIFNPPLYYSTTTSKHKSEREVMEFELSNLRKSDVVIANLNQPSIGTAMELIIAKENRIPVIGYYESQLYNISSIHPWVQECCTRLCESWSEMLYHVVNFYLT